jgi:single-strand DNA-binding protein
MPALRSVNKVIIVGNLTRDAEVNFTASGIAVCSFTVATNSAWKGANGEQHEDAAYHRASVWGKFGENLAKILTKGMKVYVEGELTYREKRDEAGKITSRDAGIRVDTVTILDRPGARGDSGEEYASAKQDTKDSGEFDLEAISQGMDDAKPAAKKAAAPVTDDDLPF